MDLRAGERMLEAVVLLEVLVAQRYPLVVDINSQAALAILKEIIYRVAHLLQERNLLTSNSKFRCRPGSQDKLIAKRNFNFGVNIFLSQSRWATLYLVHCTRHTDVGL